ncbi:MAG: biotin/lipoyl-binding protein, partial [bacterium]|nr:biotin/lipoyl-binding protein [bacterium]
MSEQQEEIKKQKKQELLEAMATNLELRSDEVQEIMGYIPAWIIRWGITLIFIIICVFLIGSWFFQYPDVIMSQIEVTTENPPAAIMARTNGKIQHLFVKDNHKVKAGEFIGVLETAADYHHLLELKRKLLSLKSLSPRYDESGTLHFSENASLGQLQTPYSTFFKAYSDYRQFLQLDHITKRITALKNQLERRKIVIDTTDRQNTIMTQELELSKNQYKRSETLFNDKIISKNEFDAAKSTYLQKEYSLEGSKSSLASQRIQLSQVKQSIIDLAIEQKE